MKASAAIVLCSRPQSSRLPGKVFRRIAGHPALHHLLVRLGEFNLPVILAVPEGCDTYDATVRDYGKLMDLRLFKGDPASPLHRSWAAIQSLPERPKWMVRVTHDDILIDAATTLELLSRCDELDGVGYGISPGIVEGAGVEVIRVENLRRAAEEVKTPTEYLSYFVKNRPFPAIVAMPPRQSIRRDYRLTLDYYEDWLVLDTVLNATGPWATVDEVCKFIDLHPHIMGWNRQPTVTFYTCVKDGARFLRETMQSVLRQAGFDFEYLVIDDGSNDDTALIVSEFSHDRRVRFFKNDLSMGLASASNQALEKARSRYIMRVDADDILGQGSTLAMIKALIPEKAVAVYAGYDTIDAVGKVLAYGEDPRRAHHAGCALFDRRFLNEIRFSEGLRHFDGADLHRRIDARGDRISYLDYPLWYYRRHDRNLSGPQNRTERLRTKRLIGLAAEETATSLHPNGNGHRPSPTPMSSEPGYPPMFTEPR